MDDITFIMVCYTLICLVGLFICMASEDWLLFALILGCYAVVASIAIWVK